MVYDIRRIISLILSFAPGSQQAVPLVDQQLARFVVEHVHAALVDHVDIVQHLHRTNPCA